MCVLRKEIGEYPRGFTQLRTASPLYDWNNSYQTIKTRQASLSMQVFNSWSYLLVPFYLFVFFSIVFFFLIVGRQRKMWN